MRCCICSLPLLLLLLCCARPCRLEATIPAAPCRAEGADAEGWRVATSICRSLEEMGAEVERVDVDGAHLSLTFSASFGGQLLTDEEAFRESIFEILSLMSRETGSSEVSMDVFSGEAAIASAATSETEPTRITILR